MKKSFLLFCPLFLLLMLFNEKETTYDAGDIQKIKLNNALDCGPGTDDQTKLAANSRFIVLLPGWGNHDYSISTKEDSAQIFFNQGLSMYYSYHLSEAIASFREAGRFDSSSAMAYWGQALAMGPSYNSGYLYKMNPRLEKIISVMNQHARNASPKEKDLIAAMNARYDIKDAEDKRRDQLNMNYAEKMRSLVKKYPEDRDLKALYVDAVMLIHPWSFWNNNGTAKPWTEELVRYAEEILAEDPHHPAALHYYIHLTEASRKPEVALASADSLRKLYPGVAHMVHMSSHEYERIGYYSKGVKANEEADNSIVQYDSLAKGYLTLNHVPHYYAVEAYCALSGAMYKKGMPKTMTCRKSMEPSMQNFRSQYQYMFPSLAWVRMGKWQDILADTTSINKDWIFASILDDFSKGMAYVKTGNFSEAEKLLKNMREKMRDKILLKPITPFASSPSEISQVPLHILAANLQYEQGDYKSAIIEIKKAIQSEDSLLYAEPKAWILPARQYLGAFLLELKKPAQAEAAYREDLVWNPGNGWSVLGLYQSLKAQGKTTELAALKARYMESFSEADEVPIASAY